MEVQSEETQKRMQGRKLSRHHKEHWTIQETSLAVQWLSLHASTAGGMGSIPGGGTKIPDATWCGQKKKKRTLDHSRYNVSLEPYYLVYYSD